MTRDEAIEIVNSDADVTEVEAREMFAAVFGRAYDPNTDGHAYSMICEAIGQ